MAKKIYVTGNYFFVEDTVTGDLATGLSHKVKVTSSSPTSTNFKITGTDKDYNLVKVAFADIIDSGDSAFANRAAFETFYTANSGQPTS